MKKPSKFVLIENTGIVLVWLALFSIPVFSYRILNSVSWSKVFQDWILTASYLLAFAVNLYLLIPLLLTKQKYPGYVFAVLALILITSTAAFALSQTGNWERGLGMPPMELGPGQPPMELSESMPPPVGYNSTTSLSAKSPLLSYLGILMITFLVVASGTAYKVVLIWIRERRLMKELQESPSLNPSAEQTSLFVKANLKNVRIELDKIHYIESANEYIRIHLEPGEVITTFMRLKHMEATLPAQKFMRVHRSFIVNLEKIKAVEKRRLLIGTNSYIPIGEQFKERFDDYLRQKTLDLNPV